MSAGPLPLTAAQQGVVDAAVLRSSGENYLLAEYTVLRGPVAVSRLMRSITAMVEATPAERIRLRAADSQIKQVIEPAEAVSVDVLDLSEKPAPAAAAREAMTVDLAVRRDPFEEVTTRHLVLVLGPDEVWWYHRAHHVALDGYGFALCVADVFARYRGDTVPDRSSEIAYRRLIDADLAYEGSSRFQNDREYWHTLLADRPVTIGRVRRDGSPRGVIRSNAPGVEAFCSPIPAPLIMLAAVGVDTARHRRAREVVLGVPLMNRIGAPFARTPGMILNVVALPLRVDDDMTGSDLIAEIGEALGTASRHGRYRHERLRRELGRFGGVRSLFGPVVNVMAFDYSAAVGPLTARTHNLSAGPVEDLSFQVYARGGRIDVACDGAATRHSAVELAERARAVVALASAIAADPEASLSTLGREQQVLTVPSTAPPETLSARIERWAAERPSAPAVIVSGREVDRGSLASMITACAERLRLDGIVEGDVVVRVGTDDRLDLLVSILAIQRIGAAHLVPPADAVDDVIAELRAGGVSTVLVRGDRVERICVGSEGPVFGGYIVMTSGSTGRRKLVRVGSTALDCFVEAIPAAYGWGEDDRVAALAPWHADTSIEETFGTLGVGAAVVLPEGRGPFTPLEFFDLARRCRVTVLDLPTSLWHESVPLVVAAPEALPPSLRQIVIGGEPVSATLVDRWVEVAESIELIDSYGPSEATVVNLTGRLSRGTDAGMLSQVMGHCGTLVRRDMTGDESTGELVVFGPIIADGYVDGREGGFADVVVAGRRFPAFATGDLVSVTPDGGIRLHGRADDMIKVGGRRVHLRTIEDALLALTGVREAMVVREGGFALVAYIVGDECDECDDVLIRRELARTLPREWVPTSIRVRERLPRGSNVKLDRGFVVAGRSGADPLTGTVTRLVSEVLGEPIGADEDFFDAGITSVGAVALAARLSPVLGSPVTVDQVLDAGTPASLAGLLRADGPPAFDLGRELSSLSIPVQLGEQVADAPILLTGGNGFVGRRLLVRLAAEGTTRILAPVRAEDDAAAIRRLVGDGATSVGDQIRAGVQSGRIIVTSRPIEALVRDPAVEFSAVVHGAARVSALAPYTALRADNVELTAVLVNGAVERGAPMLFLSTATASGVGGGPADLDLMPTGYARTKVVAERFVLQRSSEHGWPAVVARLPRVLPAAADAGRPDDFLCTLAEACARVGLLPDTAIAEPMADIGDVVQALAALLPIKEPNLVDLWSGSVSVADVLAVGSRRAPRVPVMDWRSAVEASTMPDSERAATLTWADILLSGFTHDWSHTAGLVEPCTAGRAASRLQIQQIWHRYPAARSKRSSGHPWTVPVLTEHPRPGKDVSHGGTRGGPR